MKYVNCLNTGKNDPVFYAIWGILKCILSAFNAIKTTSIKTYISNANGLYKMRMCPNSCLHGMIKKKWVRLLFLGHNPCHSGNCAYTKNVATQQISKCCCYLSWSFIFAPVLPEIRISVGFDSKYSPNAITSIRTYLHCRMKQCEKHTAENISIGTR